jgi:hypothetical protein
MKLHVEDKTFVNVESMEYLGGPKIPHGHCSAARAVHDVSAIRADVESKTSEVVGIKSPDDFTRRDVPRQHGAIDRAGKCSLAVGTELHVDHGNVVTGKTADLLPGLYIPEDHSGFGYRSG